MILEVHVDAFGIPFPVRNNSTPCSYASLWNLEQNICHDQVYTTWLVVLVVALWVAAWTLHLNKVRYARSMYPLSVSAPLGLESSCTYRTAT